jgi:hypothetical protein
MACVLAQRLSQRLSHLLLDASMLKLMAAHWTCLYSNTAPLNVLSTCGDAPHGVTAPAARTCSMQQMHAQHAAPLAMLRRREDAGC